MTESGPVRRCAAAPRASTSRSGGTLDTGGTLAPRLPSYAAAGVTRWIESVEIDEPGWREAVAARVRGG